MESESAKRTATLICSTGNETVNIKYFRWDFYENKSG